MTQKKKSEAAKDFAPKENENASEKFGLYYIHNGKPCFWKGKVMLPTGVVSGKVTKAAMKTFLAKAPKDIDLDKWVFPVDKNEERLKKAKAKMKKKLGLD